MSFPKAKIHRFNEDISCAPPPGRYDPKLDTKVKGAVLPTSKRFPDQICSSSSLDCLDKSNQSQVTFRTPQLARKTPVLTPRLKQLREKNFDTPGSSGSSNTSDIAMAIGPKIHFTRSDYQRLENELSVLADKHLCEILERELEISKLKQDLEEVKTHEAELKVILEEKSKLAAERTKEVLEVKDNLDTFVVKINEEREEHKKYIEELRKEIAQLQTKKEDLEGIVAEKQSAIVTINDKYLDLENKLKDLKEEQDNYKNDVMKMEKTNSEILERVVTTSEHEMETLENNFKLKIESLQQNFDDAQHNVQVDFQTKLNFMAHEFSLKRNEVENQLEICSKRIKELEKVVENKTKDFSTDIEEANERCKYIYRALCKVEQERDNLLVSDLEKKLSLVDIQEKADVFESDLEQCKEKCKRYEITLNTMQETIQALTNRLLDSENEVERLSKVELDLETQKKLLEEKSHLLFSDITALREGMDRMEKDIVCDVQAMKDHLAAKVEHFKAEAAKQIAVLNNKIKEKQGAINMLLHENEYFKTELEKKDDYVRNLRNKIKQCKEENVNLRKESYLFEEEVTERLNAQKNLLTIVNEKLEFANKEITELQNVKMNKEKEISILVEKCDKYVSAVEEATKEVASLKIENLQQSENIRSLTAEMKKNELLLEKKTEKENKQLKYIDGLISDLVLEKERCVSLENELKSLNFSMEVSSNEKLSEIARLSSKVESLERSLRNAEEKITLIDEEKNTLEVQLIEIENSTSKVVKIVKESKEESERKIIELQTLLSSAKEKLKSEIPHLERDNINKAQYILELSMNIDSLNDVIKEKEAIINCVEAEKSSLSLQLEEAKSSISSYKNTLDSRNVMINNLSNQVSVAEANYQESLEEIEKLHDKLNKQNEQLKLNIEETIKITDAEEKIAWLEEQLLQNEEEFQRRSQSSEKSEFEIQHLREELDSTKSKVQVLEEELEERKMKLQKVLEERERQDKELAELMGHQNIHQKIKHVTQLKQSYIEMRERNESLEIENVILKKKLAEFKENATPRIDSSPKAVKQKTTRKGLSPSPAVLKDRNH